MSTHIAFPGFRAEDDSDKSKIEYLKAHAEKLTRAVNELLDEVERQGKEIRKLKEGS